ncbi:MAG TPA: hypothetical protein DDZ91_05440 [Firmicutes bacterium]|jgi:G3E family GTPase|nr:hypothetical protein [Bacillota bacterium]
MSIKGVSPINGDNNYQDATKTKTKLYILAGFFGAGKTTLLNNLLTLLKGHKVGVLVNEFGAVGIDSARLVKSDDTPVIELNNGQIFCSCLAGSFVKNIISLLEFEPDYLLVESSGLAKPAPLMAILAEIHRKAGDSFTYQGMISVVDAKTYPVLSQTVHSLNEQLKYSDLFLLNKTDLVTPEIAVAIRNELHQLKPKAKIVETTFCRIDPSILEIIPTTPAEIINTIPAPSLKQVLRITLTQEQVLTEQALMEFLQQASLFAQRIKGDLKLTQGLVKIDTVGESITIQPLNHSYLITQKDYCLSVLADRNADKAEGIVSLWRRIQDR